MALSAPAGQAQLVAGISPTARLHIVSGKGGTGKTTAAAALGLALASLGKKVLLIEVEGRQALAQLFDVPALPYAEQKLATAEHGGQLFGLAIDAEEAMIEYLEMFYNMKRAARGLKKIGAVDFATTLAPGLRDVLLTGKIKESVVRVGDNGRHVYDTVVLDAPPTGRIRQFLSATREVANLTNFGPINRQSEGVVEVLHGTMTQIHLVTLLEEMPVQETVDAVTELQEGGYNLGCVIVNRARPTLIGDNQVGAGGVDQDLLVQGLAKANLPGEFAAGLAAQMVDYAMRQRLQDETKQRLDEVRLPRVELPDLNPPVELGELKDLADRFLKTEA
jgi:anion-transporting  ArsA/GET3 family ATPase